MFKPSSKQIYDWVSRSFPDFKARKNGTELSINNPLSADNGYHLGINTETGQMHDWRSDSWAGNKSRTFLRFVQLYRKCSYLDAIKDVCSEQMPAIDEIYNRLRDSQKQTAKPAETGIALPPGSLPLFDNAETLNGKLLMRWLRSRGMTDDMVQQANLYFIGMRVIWPYYEYGEMVYWQERDRLNKVFRFPPESVGVSKGMFLYGFDNVEPNSYVAITEAIFGSSTIGDQAIASGGASLTDTQVQKIRTLNPIEGVILAPDNDKAGMDSLVYNYRQLSPHVKKIFMAVPPKIRIGMNSDKFTKDWNELITDAKMDRFEVQKAFEDSVKPLNQNTIIRLMVGSV